MAKEEVYCGTDYWDVTRDRSVAWTRTDRCTQCGQTYRYCGTNLLSMAKRIWRHEGGPSETATENSKKRMAV